jgi:hypothetical protein
MAAYSGVSAAQAADYDSSGPLGPNFDKLVEWFDAGTLEQAVTAAKASMNTRLESEWLRIQNRRREIDNATSTSSK